MTSTETEQVRLHLDNPDPDAGGPAGECMWGTATGRPGVYELDNFPIITDAFTAGDLVHAEPSSDGTLEISGLAERRFEAILLGYSGVATAETDEGTNARAAIRKHLEAAGFRLEWLVAGLVGVAVPVGLDEATLGKVLLACPSPVWVVSENE